MKCYKASSRPTAIRVVDNHRIVLTAVDKFQEANLRFKRKISPIVIETSCSLRYVLRSVSGVEEM